MEEVWKDIEGTRGVYQVSNHGWYRRTSGKTTHNAKSGIGCPRDGRNVNGYRQAVLCVDGIVTYIYVHQLVAIAFVPMVEGKPCVNHKDGIKTNNHFSNLEWMTLAENLEHSRTVLGNSMKGERHGMHKLREEDIRAIRLLKGTGLSQTKIGEMFGVTQSMIGHIMRGINWSHVA